MTDAGVGVARYYDRLSRWNSAARVFGYGGGQRDLTVHRALADPRADGRATTSRLHDVLIDELNAFTDPTVLDAGCGLGGTMIDVVRRRGGRSVGLTLSAAQAAIAATAIAAAGLEDRVRVLVQSYDAPPPGPFDVILAIEAFAHSDDPAVTLAACTRVLAPGGALAIVDDMPEPAAAGSADLAAFKRGWRSPALWTAEEYRRHLAANGFFLAADRDLTSECRPRSLPRIGWLQALNRTARHLAPSAGLRDVLDSHYGGLALERLLQSGLVRYRFLLARRGAL